MASGGGRFAGLGLSLGAAAILAVAWSAGVDPPPVSAAPCPPITVTLDGGGNLSIQGTTPCDVDPESFTPACTAGTVHVDYTVNGAPQGTTNTGVACGAPRSLSVFGRDGEDEIDLSQVSAANGFTGINQPNVIDGGSGLDTLIGGPTPGVIRGGTQNDFVLARNGVADTVDCGDGLDAVQSDAAGVDSISNCEIEDIAPTPPKTCVVPDLTGQKTAAAKQALAAANCGVKVKRKRSSHKKGRVFRQSPTAGTSGPAGTVVTIKISRGRGR